MFHSSELKAPRALRTHGIMAELPKAIHLLLCQAIVDEIVPQVITIQCAYDFEQTGLYEVILWGD